MRQQPGAPNGCQMIPRQGPPHSHLPWAAGKAWKMRDGPVCAAGPRGEGGAEAGASAHAQGSGASFALASQRPGEVPLPSPPPLQVTEGPSCGQSLRKEACGPARWDWPSPNPGSSPPLKHNVFIRSCRGNRTQAGRVGGRCFPVKSPQQRRHSGQPARTPELCIRVVSLCVCVCVCVSTRVCA